MNKILLFLLALSLAALACAPGPQVVPAGPATPAPQDQGTPPVVTPVPQPTPTSTGAPTTAPKGEPTVTLRAEALANAKSALEQDSTFRFDGIKESVALVGEKSLEGGQALEFVYTFDSRYPGYGDRAGRILAAVITPHKVRIVVRGGAIAEAVMDEKWDMLGQKMIEKKAN